MTNKINVVLDWFPNTIHVGFLLALKRGYYREAGLDVTVNGHVHGVMESEEGDIVCGPAASMLEEMTKTGRLIGLGQITYKQDSGLVSLKSAGIERPRDLEGKRLTHWEPKWFHLLISELMKKDGADYDKVEKIQMDVGRPEEVLGKSADAIWIYKDWEYYVMENLGFPCNFINIADYGEPFNYPTPAIAARRTTWEEKPDAIRAFMKASERGYQDVVKLGTAVIPEIRDLLPDVDDKILYDGLTHLLPMFLNEEGRWGLLDQSAWQSLQKLFMESRIYGTDYPKETYIEHVGY